MRMSTRTVGELQVRLALVALALCVELGCKSATQVGTEGEGVRVAAVPREKRQEAEEMNTKVWRCNVRDSCYAGERNTCRNGSQGNISCTGGDCKQQCGHGCTHGCWANSTCSCSHGLCYCKK